MKKRVLLLAPLLIACGPYFYQAPPPLEKYPSRTAGKSWRELFDAAKPLPQDARQARDMLAEVSRIANDFPTLTPERRREVVSKLSDLNRDGEFSARSATLLHELSELTGEDELLPEAAPYLAWRTKTLTRRSAGPPPRRKWNDTDESYQLALDEHSAQLRKDIDWLEEGRVSTQPGLMPNFQTQRAALLMQYGRLEEALEGFKEVIASVPQHPRAEAARFMVGRCLLAQARAATRDKKGGEAPLRNQATEAFRSYLQQHPKGRFVPDAHGWLGAVAADERRFGDAVGHQLDRLAARATRETLESVMRECDSLFVALCEDPQVEAKPEQLARSLPWRAIARSPEITRIFVYQALDPASRHKLPLYEDNYSGDFYTLEFLNERIVRPRQVAKRGLSLLGGAMLREGGEADPLTLTVLGWSSLRAGEAEQALGLFDKALRKGRSDELLQGRAAALSALRRHARAATAYDDLKREFPNSPLAMSADFDAALATYKAGEAGEALLRLWHSVNSSAPAQPEPTLHPEFEDPQWLDSIAQFAPIQQLAAPLQRLEAGDPEAARLRAIVRCRALAEGRFDLARKHLDAAGPPEEPEKGTIDFQFLPWEQQHAMDQALWDQEVAPLADAYAKLAKQPKNATLQLEAGRLWQARRGRLTMPLHDLFKFSNSEPHKIDELRRKNGAFLGLAPDKVEAILDSHDELHHALDHFLAAAKLARDPAVAAAALEEANETLFHLYEYSPYRVARAMEEKHVALSARLVGRLKKEFPKTSQAARAVAWVFREVHPPEEGVTGNVGWTIGSDWMPGRARHWDADEALSEGLMGRNPNKYERIRWSDEERAAYRDLDARFDALATQDERDLPALKAELAELRGNFAKLRKILGEDMILKYVDQLDDFASVLEAPGISPELFRAYVTMRRSNAAPPPPEERQWQPLKPWLAFYDRIRLVSRGDYYQTPNNNTPASWEAYLKEFPDGPKSEAASLRLIRSKIKLACPMPKVEESEFPEAPIPNGYPSIDMKPSPAPEALDGLLTDLAAHQQRYPEGRYSADVTLLRARVNAAKGEIRNALAGCATILSDPEHNELRMDAALYLSYFGLRLLEPQERLATAEAFRATPAALPFLRNAVTGETCLYRLRPLLAWLEGNEPDQSPKPRPATP